VGYQLRRDRAVNPDPAAAAEKINATNAASAISRFLDKRPF
jgi:hypothetical protein